RPRRARASFPTRRSSDLLEALDIQVVDGAVQYGAYPDALPRVEAALNCVNAGDVLMSGTPGWEYRDLGGVTHSGGSHGSLHVSADRKSTRLNSSLTNLVC